MMKKSAHRRRSSVQKRKIVRVGGGKLCDGAKTCVMTPENFEKTQKRAL
jgi:hypothetical protein